MIALLIFLLRLLALPSKSKRGLEAENAAFGRQLTILQRKVRSRVRLTNSDRQEGPDFDRRNGNSASLRPHVLHQLTLLSLALEICGTSQ
jgi:hypothetical protein